MQPARPDCAHLPAISVSSSSSANCFSPGPIDTPLVTRGDMSEAEISDFRKMIETISPMGRFGSPEEAAGAVLFLASRESSYVTGIDLLVDGGAVSF